AAAPRRADGRDPRRTRLPGRGRRPAAGGGHRLSPRPATRAATLAALACATLLGGCASPQSARPTDPRAILAAAIVATAALPTARVHIELTAPIGGGLDRPVGPPGNQPGQLLTVQI